MHCPYSHQLRDCHHLFFFFNIAGELPDLQALPQPCSIKNNADSDSMELNNNDNNNNNNNNNDNKEK